MIGVHGLALFEEVIEDVISHGHEPLEIVELCGRVPAIRKEQVLEVEQYNLCFFIEFCIKALNRVHPMEVGLPWINLRCSLDALADVLIFCLVVQFVLILIKFTDW